MKLRILLLVVMVSAGCSDDGGERERDGAGPLDVGPDRSTLDLGTNLPDGYGPLYSCAVPGQACNAHDPCAIDPVCGPDHKCYPSSLMDCDDHLSCTVDTCKGQGLCENVPKAGTCALPVQSGGGGPAPGAADAGLAADAGGAGGTTLQCFLEGQANPGDPCQICDPTEDDGGAGKGARSWSPKTGGKCDDHDLCTKDDTCVAGTCKGTSFADLCSDSLSCTRDLCDGKGGCQGNTLMADWCLISGTCYAKNATHPTGSCFTCDPQKSPSDWTAITDSCLISGKCYNKGATNPAGCGECAPSSSTTAWTVTGKTCCLIGGVAYTAGAADTTGCSTCDPTKDRYDWTPLTGKCKISGKCYSSGDPNPAGCGECAPGTKPTDWTVLGTTCCLIGGVAYNAGVKDTAGCSSCNPAKDKYGWTPLSGVCLIGGKCYSPGDPNPGGCGECAPGTSGTKWTVTGTTCCLINNLSYTAGVNDATKCYTCDPTADPYDWTARGGICTIDSACYEKGDLHAGGCAACDPPTSTTRWTVTGTTHCLIKDSCTAAGTNDPAGCSSCDPTADPYDWTPFSGKCMINGTCYSDGAPHPQGCAECDSATSATDWTLTNSAYCVKSYKCFSLCGGVCYDQDNDVNNCGSCGHKCSAGDVCRNGLCGPDCKTLEDFEAAWPGTLWTAAGSTTGTRGTVSAHDGTYGVRDPDWHYEASKTVGATGDRLQLWTRSTTSLGGRSYLGFLADAAGCTALALAPNTNQLLLQQMSGGYSTFGPILASTSFTVTAKKWYLLEVEFLGLGKIKGTVYDSDGKTALRTLTHTLSGVTSTLGGVALRAFNDHDIDTVKTCSN